MQLSHLVHDLDVVILAGAGAGAGGAALAEFNPRLPVFVDVVILARAEALALLALWAMTYLRQSL